MFFEKSDNLLAVFAGIGYLTFNLPFFMVKKGRKRTQAQVLSKLDAPVQIFFGSEQSLRRINRKRSQ